MPTGYTAKLMDKGETFQEFILGCARAFGACIDMRDDSSDTPIPEKFEPSNYHTEKLKENKEELLKLKAMSEEEKISFSESKKDKELNEKKEWLNKKLEENKRLEDMKDQVQAWRPPTKDHQGLKDFMLQQIKISKHDLNYITDKILKLHKRTPISFYVDAVSDCAWGISYHQKESQKEIDRVNQRNEWLKQLRNSI